MLIAIIVEPYYQVNKTVSISTHANNQLNYIKAILNPSLNINKKGNNKTAAVMIILIIIDKQLNVLLTHRTNTVSTHKDQVSFPGGLNEINDDGLIQTALRETEEEIGLIIENNEILGRLPEQNLISGFHSSLYLFHRNSSRPQAKLRRGETYLSCSPGLDFKQEKLE